VGGRGRVEQQRPGQRVDHLGGRILVASLLQAQVVVAADAGQHRELLAAKAGHPPPLAGDEPHVLGPHQAASGAQVLAEGVHLVHDSRLITVGRA